MCLVTKCGTFTVKVSTAASDTHTAGTETSPTLTVNKANDTATAPTAKTVTYYGSAQELVNAGSTNDGTLYCAVTTENKAPTDEKLYTTSIPTKTDAGTYVVWYKAFGDQNHNDTDPVRVSVTIASQSQPEPEVQPPRDLYIIPASVEPIKVKEKVQLAAATDNPDISLKKLKWSSSNKKVATVTKKGEVTGKGEGTATITASIAKKYFASIDITVKDAEAPTGVRFADGIPTELDAGDSFDLAPYVILEPDTAKSKLTWSTSDKTVATVKKGNVTGKGGGTATITVTTANDFSASIVFNVKDTAAPTAAQLEAPPARPLGVKEKLTINVTFEPADAKPKKIKWTSSNRKVATVNNKGEVTGKGQGTAIITATAGSVSASVEIAVLDYTMPTDIVFTEGVPNTVVVKGSIELAPFVKMAPDTAKSKLTWTSSDKKIATVTKGKVTGKAEGTAEITVTPTRNKSLSLKINVIVTAPEQ